MQRETLTVRADEVRFASDDEGVFTGYASIFGEPDSYGDTIRPGAFRKALSTRAATGGPPMFWNHDPSQPIGVWTELVEDSRGLKVTGRLITETRAGAEALALLKAGAVNGLSIGFRARKSERGAKGGRVLTDIDLVEISLVSLPAASNARVTSVRHDRQPAGTAAFVQAVRRAAASLKG
ncbi:HK97 family phage prohead protease [Acuticoccus sediminis]|uniref:HK97 family phage prohead protease n=1 Tax=Acuticoccus sediminis TaxID=2184697 RepID=A0A8B2NJP8_9HYPH|nr:HK97 family phage prohead protease [Acuticoccus sediminis]RAH99854.1 HK97 family phage prohead protease [Acuticoccus sediminis]